MAKKLAIIVGMAALLAGCYTPITNPGDVHSLEGLQEMNSAYLGGPHGYRWSSLGDIRFTAIKETALSLGARAALAWRSKEINLVLCEDETILDQAYDFYGLMLSNNVVPPVLQEARDTLNLASPDTIRLASQVFRIKTQAHFVTAPPTWRDYILMSFPEPDRPDNSLLPKNRREQAVWNHYVTEGWDHGVTQANAIFAADLARLNSDYKGMVLYRELYEENMVSAPFVARTSLGITGNGSAMSVDDQVLRITALPQLNLRANTWKPILIPDPLSKYNLDLIKQLSPPSNNQVSYKIIPRKMKTKLYVK